jgi:hypothetical protein
MTIYITDLRAITALTFPEHQNPTVYKKEPNCLYITFSNFLAKCLVYPVGPIFGKRWTKYWSNRMISRVRAGLLPLFSAGNFIRLGPSAKFLSLMIAEAFCRGELPQILQEPMWSQDENEQAQILYYRKRAIERKVFEIASGYLRLFLSGETRMSLPVFKALQTLVLFSWRAFEKSIEQNIILFECGSELDHESSDVTMCMGVSKPRDTLDEYYKLRQLLGTIREVIQRLAQSIESKSV